MPVGMEMPPAKAAAALAFPMFRATDAAPKALTVVETVLKTTTEAGPTTMPVFTVPTGNAALPKLYPADGTKSPPVVTPHLAMLFIIRLNCVKPEVPTSGVSTLVPK